MYETIEYIEDGSYVTGVEYVNPSSCDPLMFGFILFGIVILVIAIIGASVLSVVIEDKMKEMRRKSK